MDDPPRWFKDPVARRELPSGRPGFRLNHRRLPEGSDIKVIWEASRWPALVRLAQCAWVHADAAAAKKCVDWLDHWQRRNRPYLGWNWTSALEAGIRLLNFAWIDALLGGGDRSRALGRLRARILPAHVWYVARHRLFGSSANNHLLGELAGLIAALWGAGRNWSGGVVRWRTCRRAGSGRRCGFAPDGGNREQALNYQLFSWNCAGTRATRCAPRGGPSPRRSRNDCGGRRIFTWRSSRRPTRGTTGIRTVRRRCRWSRTRRGRGWSGSGGSPNRGRVRRCNGGWGIRRPPCTPPACVPGARDWMVFQESGQAVCWTGDWLLRWDLSPLGYRKHGGAWAPRRAGTAWLRDVALVIDPGTGAYYGDPRLRAWLASWAAHNGPARAGDRLPASAGTVPLGAASSGADLAGGRRRRPRRYAGAAAWHGAAPGSPDHGRGPGWVAG